MKAAPGQLSLFELDADGQPLAEAVPPPPSRPDPVQPKPAGVKPSAEQPMVEAGSVAAATGAHGSDPHLSRPAALWPSTSVEDGGGKVIPLSPGRNTRNNRNPQVDADTRAREDDELPAPPAAPTKWITVRDLAHGIGQTPGATRKLLERGLIPGARRITPGLKNSPWLIPPSAPDDYNALYEQRKEK